jgi:hypothetical protein
MIYSFRQGIFRCYIKRSVWREKYMALTKKEKEELQEFIRQEVENAVKDAMEYDRLEMAKLVKDVEDFIGDHHI